MIKLSNNCVLVDSPSDLPGLPLRIDRLYLDVETYSGSDSLSSLNPWKNCWANIAAVTWDDDPKVYGINFRDDEGNPISQAVDFVREAFKRSSCWVNQNVKYDAHVLYNDLGLEFTGEFRDTLTLSKLVDSDRTYKPGGYSLDAQAKHYCGVDLSHYYSSLAPYVGSRVSKNYGNIPLPILADYACNQVRANRTLQAELERLLPSECEGVYATERRLTRTLIDMERRGFCIDVDGVKAARLRSCYRMMKCAEELEARCGYLVNPNSQPDCEDLLINRYGMKAIYLEKKGVRSKGPSFCKAVLKEYLLDPNCPRELVNLIWEFRHESTMTSIYWDAWLELQVDGVLHSDNNQCVRSGRLSASQPNSMQLNDEARELVVPRPGYKFVCCDYSQVEYRLIIHYIENQRISQAYTEDPDMDFHQFMADECHIARKPAKILNLAMGFGMGKRKTIQSLQLEESIQEFTKGDEKKARELAVKAHGAFHRRLPELKPETKAAENACRLRGSQERDGWVQNAYGRRSHIPLKFSRVAFNRVVQGHAADLIKERANALDERRHKYGAYMLALVHDETVSEVPHEAATEYAAMKQDLLCRSSVPLRVPITCSCGISDHSWLGAKKAGDTKPDVSSESPIELTSDLEEDEEILV